MEGTNGTTSASRGFELLHPVVQHFIWSQGWTELRDVQEQSIEPVLGAQRDVVIAAETAAGKTEAAFLPVLSRLLMDEKPGLIVYVSPIKALINDQFSRLQLLCEQAEIPVWPWHGDVSSSVKARFRAKPHGVLLITPEALEALLCTRGSTAALIFDALRYFIIDELHAFIGTERGKQLQSLLHRIELLLERRVARIGLSATLGDMPLAARFLRPGASLPDIVQASSTQSSLKLIVKGYEEPFVEKAASVSDVEAGEAEEDTHESAAVAPGQIAEHLFRTTVGSNNLIFPNSRQQVEAYTALLNKHCEAAGIAQAYWPHHGSLSKELRTDAEQALKAQDQAASAVCTNTLELGIDIGAVRSVAQIGTPYSVASLRQRLGRSGRRPGESKILRGYSVEMESRGAFSLSDVLRLDTVQLAAMVRLLLEGWFEPPAQALHFSTLVQQLMSLVAQYSGLTAAQAWQRLCGQGAAFEGLSRDDFVLLLRHLGKLQLITQDSGGALLHGARGEKLVNHYSFYAAFNADEEYRIVTGGKTLGSLPVSHSLKLGQKFLFAGKSWRIENIDDAQKTLNVSRAKGGAAPLYSSGRGSIHERVRAEMRKLLEGSGAVPFLDPTAAKFLKEARGAYQLLALSKTTVLGFAGSTHVLTWSSDAVNAALALLLQQRGFSAWPSTLGVEISLGQLEPGDVVKALRKAAEEGVPSLHELLAEASNLEREKWDWALPRPLLERSFASAKLDLKGLSNWLAATFGAAAPAN